MTRSMVVFEDEAQEVMKPSTNILLPKHTVGETMKQGGKRNAKF